jgi:hypothetical protein
MTMSRRNFVTTSAAGAGLLLMPTWVIASIGEPWVKVTRFRVGLERDMVQLGVSPWSRIC